MKVGFVINPIAGLGGKVALKGTDGLAQKAIQLGATPVSPERAELFFTHLQKQITVEMKKNIIFYTVNGAMGEETLSKYNFNYKIVPLEISDSVSTAEDTTKSVKLFESESVELIIFVGGDGTSLDIGQSIKNSTPILGIPSGVKTYGSVFAHTIEDAVTILISFCTSKAVNNAELMDLDEELYRSGILSIALKGIVQVPAYPEYFQQAKERTEGTESEKFVLIRIAEELYEILADKPINTLIIIGPGSTFNPFAKKVNLLRSLLGVDCILKSSENKFDSILIDSREDQLFDLVSKYKSIILLVTPIGGLGYLFGRGNHQLSPRVLRKITKENIIIVCSNQKLNSIKDSVLRVDSSDQNFNSSMVGFMRVITDINEQRMMKIIH